MATAPVLLVPTNSLTEQSAHAERRRIIDSALGTTLAEGVSPGPEVLALAERFVLGDITLEEMGSAVRSMSGL